MATGDKKDLAKTREFIEKKKIYFEGFGEGRRLEEKRQRELEIRQQQAQQKQERAAQKKDVSERQRQLNIRNERNAYAKIEAARIREDAKTQRMQMRMQASAARRAARANRGMTGSPTVAGAIMGSIVASVLLFAVIVSTGPLVDYFQLWLIQQNGNPYAAPVLDLFTWIYILAFVSWITYIIVVWRAVTMNVSYGVYD